MKTRHIIAIIFYIVLFTSVAQYGIAGGLFPLATLAIITCYTLIPLYTKNSRESQNILKFIASRVPDIAKLST